MGKIDKARIPSHVAIIMDGNGRWAKKKGLARIFGHREGANSVDRITEEAARLGIKALTLYSFSTENWKRSDKEINGLMNLLGSYLDKKFKKLMDNNIRLNAIGELEKLPSSVREKLSLVIKKTSKNSGMILTLALSYGGRQEIIHAAKQVALKLKNNSIEISDITEKFFSEFLYTKNLPEVDLLIRTSGEMRVSNFLLWQICYSEIYVTDTFWPDFDERELEKAILEYQKRERRYGR